MEEWFKTDNNHKRIGYFVVVHFGADGKSDTLFYYTANQTDKHVQANFTSNLRDAGIYNHRSVAESDAELARLACQKNGLTHKIKVMELVGRVYEPYHD